MLRMMTDSVRFPEKPGAGRTIMKKYSTYPHPVRQVSASLSGIDYGFSDVEGSFFRSQIQLTTQILSTYTFQVSTLFGFRAQEFDKRVDATIQYNLLIESADSSHS